MTFSRFIAECKRGLNAADATINLLWTNKILILYLLLPVSLGKIVEVLFYNLYFFQPSFTASSIVQSKFVQLFESYSWLQILLVALFIVLETSLITWFTVGLSYHTNQLVTGSDVRLLDVLLRVKNRIKNIILWSLWVLLSINLNDYLYVLIQSQQWIGVKIFLTPALIMLRIISVITFFVIPAFTFKPISMVKAILESYTAIKRELVAVLGGVLWIGLITIIISLPLATISSIFEQKATYASISLISNALLLFIGVLNLTVMYMFRTLLYVHYLNKKADELLEQEGWQLPSM